MVEISLNPVRVLCLVAVNYFSYPLSKRRKSKSKRKVSGRVTVVESKYIDLQWEMPN